MRTVLLVLAVLIPTAAEAARYPQPNPDPKLYEAAVRAADAVPASDEALCEAKIGRRRAKALESVCLNQSASTRGGTCTGGSCALLMETLRGNCGQTPNDQVPCLDDVRAKAAKRRAR